MVLHGKVEGLEGAGCIGIEDQNDLTAAHLGLIASYTTERSSLLLCSRSLIIENVVVCIWLKVLGVLVSKIRMILQHHILI